MGPSGPQPVHLRGPATLVGAARDGAADDLHGTTCQSREWGRWGLNPRPTDYESSWPPSGRLPLIAEIGSDLHVCRSAPRSSSCQCGSFLVLLRTKCGPDCLPQHNQGTTTPTRPPATSEPRQKVQYEARSLDRSRFTAAAMPPLFLRMVAATLTKSGIRQRRALEHQRSLRFITVCGSRSPANTAQGFLQLVGATASARLLQCGKGFGLGGGQVVGVLPQRPPGTAVGLGDCPGRGSGGRTATPDDAKSPRRHRRV